MIDGAFPNRLEELMRRAGVNDPALAARAGTTKQQVFKLRKGERELTVQWAKRLAPHLMVDWRELIDDPGSAGDPAQASLLEAYRALSRCGRQTLLNVAKGLSLLEAGLAEGDDAIEGGGFEPDRLSTTSVQESA